jgi:hypothetical protein
MNADTARFCANTANVNNLNSVHGIYLRRGFRQCGKRYLPIATLNSMTLLGAETVGRAYGGGMLKVEPKEADLLPVPSKEIVEAAAKDLDVVRPQVAQLLQNGRLIDAVRLVDDALLVRHAGLSEVKVEALRDAHVELRERRASRGPKARNGN